MTDIHQMNGLKNGLSFALSLISLVAFAVRGLVAWPQAFVMMGAATVGGICGRPDCPRPAPRSCAVACHCRWLWHERDFFGAIDRRMIRFGSSMA